MERNTAIVKRYLAGESRAELVESFGVCLLTVGEVLRAAGIEGLRGPHSWQPKNKARLRQISAAANRQRGFQVRGHLGPGSSFLEDVAAGLSQSEIAARNGVSKQAVSAAMKRLVSSGMS